MGLFDWIFGKKSPQPANRSRMPVPELLPGQDENSPMVMASFGGGGAVTIMDREMYDYQSGRRTGTDPNQAELDAVLEGVTRVRAVASGMFRGRPLGTEVVVDTPDSDAVAALRRALRVVEDPATFSHCGCLGGPTLELFAGEKLVATFGLQHGHSFRWSAWKHDAKLHDGRPLRAWLLDRGVDSEFLDVLFGNQYENGGMMGVGFLRPGPEPLTPAEQQFRLAELGRVRSGDCAAALARCDKALRKEPTAAFGYAIRAFCHNQTGDHAATAADCTKAIDLGFRDAEVLFMRAVACDYLGRVEAALADCDAALAAKPDHANVLNSRGLIRTRVGRHDEALQDFAAALRIAPNWPLPRINRTKIHLERNDLPAAIAECDAVEAAMADAKSPQEKGLLAMVLWNRGQCRRQQGDEMLAQADEQKALQLNPNLGGAPRRVTLSTPRPDV